jgi:hypothetical protein
MKHILVEERGKYELREVSGNRALKRIGLLFSDRLKIIRVCDTANSSSTNKAGILFDQILDSTIVAGITGVSAYIYAGQDASWKAAALSFLLTFLIKMKEYRKIAD